MTEGKILIAVIVASIAFTIFIIVQAKIDRDELYQECLKEGVLTPFECKAMAREMTRINT